MLQRRFASNTALALALAAFGAGVGARAARAQAPSDEAQVKAAFVYNFMKFVEWPAEVTQRAGDSLVVDVIGEGDAAEAAARFLAGRPVGDRHIVVHRPKWDQPLGVVHVVFVTESDARRLRRVADASASRPVLSIGDAASFATIGGIIGLVVDDRRVRFDIDADAADAAGLKVSSKLLALSRTVHSSKNKSGDRP